MRNRWLSRRFHDTCFARFSGCTSSTRSWLLRNLLHESPLFTNVFLTLATLETFMIHCQDLAAFEHLIFNRHIMSGLYRFWRPIWFPTLFVVEFFNDNVDLAELGLMSSFSLMSFRYNMIVEIFISHVTDLTICVINLRPWNVDHIILGMLDTLRFRHGFNLRLALRFPLVGLDLLFSLLTKSFLIKGLARIHTFGTIQHKLVDVKLRLVIFGYETACFIIFFDKLELVIGLLFVFHDLLLLWFIAVHLLAIIKQLDLWDDKVLGFFVSDPFRHLRVKNSVSLVVPFRSFT